MLAVYPSPSPVPQVQYAPPVIDPDIFSGVVQVAHAETVLIASTTSLSEEDVNRLITKYAVPLGVNQRSMRETIRCEAPKHKDDTYDPAGRSLIVKKDGTLEDSHGLAQIHLPDHPQITLAQAQDPDFSVSFMATQFAAGHASLWTCWRDLKASGKI